MLLTSQLPKSQAAVALLTCVIGLNSCVALPFDPSTATPATISRAGDGLLNVIDCPIAADNVREGLPKTASVSCRVHISEQGYANHARSGCFADTKAEQPFVVATDRAIESARFDPAIVSGRPTPVVMHLRVQFRTARPGVCDMIAIPNLGQSQELFGAAYLAPQEIALGPTWLENQEHYGLPMSYNRAAYRGQQQTLWVSVHVDRDGAGREPRAEFAERISSGMQRVATNALDDSRFIPGRVDGEPTAMRYYDVALRSARHMIQINDDRD